MEPLTYKTTPKGIMAGLDKTGVIRIGDYVISPDDFAKAVDCEDFIQLKGEGTNPKFLSINKLNDEEGPRKGNCVGVGSYTLSWYDWYKVCNSAGFSDSSGPETNPLEPKRTKKSKRRKSKK